MYKFPSARRMRVLVLFCTVFIAACSTTPSNDSLPTVADRTVAKDFTHIIAQVAEFNPSSTTLRMPRPIGFNNSFENALREGLAAGGYRIEFLDFELVSNDPVVSHSVEETTARSGDVLVYTITVGNISFRRGYSVDDKGIIRPATTMQGKGIDMAGLRQDDSIFEPVVEVAQAPTQSNGSNSALGRDTLASAQDIRAAELLIPDPEAKDQLRDPIREELIVIPPVVDASAESFSESASGDMLNLQIVSESLLTFNDGSLVLGDSNKRRVRQFVAAFNPRSDVFSVFGCLNKDQQSAVSDEDDKIAQGRAERVRSELLYAGIPSKKIFTEGCLDDSNANPALLPPDGVLLTLKRRAS